MDALILPEDQSFEITHDGHTEKYYYDDKYVYTSNRADIPMCSKKTFLERVL